MSLLMDALKRAEESKRRAEGDISGAASAADHAASASRPSESSRGSPLPDLSLHYDSVAADLATVSNDVSPPRRASANASKTPGTGSRDVFERAAARNVFAAKKPPRAASGLGLFLGLSGIAALGVCAYFWWQLQAASSGSLSRTVPAPSPVPVVSSTAPVTDTSIPAQTVTEISKQVSDARSSPVVPVLRVLPEPLPVAEPVPAPRKPLAAATQTVPESPVRLSRSLPKSNQTLEQAYAALQAGRLEEARRGYEIVLSDDAKNVDALLGLATLAARQGQNEWAQTYFLRALESDPNDPTAQAGLINLRGSSNAGSSESQLKTSLAGQPDSSALHFALGNLYARQERWSEAQQAYFHAYSIESDNADFIYNLAVSLDHLHQSKLAAEYYQMALNAAGSTNPSFDKSQVNARILDLRP